MSDLISRSKVVKLVNQFVFDLCKEQNDEVRKTFIKYIEKIPTDYDIDKVVEELNCDRCESCKFLEVCACSKCCTGCHKKAIEIVKQGGVSDDVCEWHYDEYGRWHTECHHLADNDPLEYTYCPYCGKKIKVVE